MCNGMNETLSLHRSSVAKLFFSFLFFSFVMCDQQYFADLLSKISTMKLHTAVKAGIPQR